jgi:hypothetical protein
VIVDPCAKETSSGALIAVKEQAYHLHTRFPVQRSATKKLRLVSNHVPVDNTTNSSND